MMICSDLPENLHARFSVRVVGRLETQLGHPCKSTIALSLCLLISEFEASKSEQAGEVIKEFT